MAIGKAKACADSANELVPEEYERNTKGRCRMEMGWDEIMR